MEIRIHGRNAGIDPGISDLSSSPFGSFSHQILRAIG